MDNVTHTLFGATLARTPLARAGRGTFAALVVASNAPDVDIIAALSGGTRTYLAWHRGPTHGPLGVLGLGFASAVVVWLGRGAVDRARAKRGSPTEVDADASFGMLLAVSMVGVLLHILMDLPTSYGTRLLSPFDWRWFAVDWLPIVDIYLIAALAAGLIFGQASSASRRRLAVIVLTAVAANYGMRAAAHRQALTLAPQVFGHLLPQPCGSDAAPAVKVLDVWPRASAARHPERTCVIEIAAVPTFVSPFRWQVIAQLSNGYELHDLDILDARLHAGPAANAVFWERTVRYPNQWTAATFVAARTRTAQVFLAFARFPAARTFTDPTDATTVRWSDVRFVGGPLSVEPPHPPNLFNVVVRLDADGRVLDERIGR